jgi:hypothetical protein
MSSLTAASLAHALTIGSRFRYKDIGRATNRLLRQLLPLPVKVFWGRTVGSLAFSTLTSGGTSSLPPTAATSLFSRGKIEGRKSAGGKAFVKLPKSRSLMMPYLKNIK